MYFEISPVRVSSILICLSCYRSEKWSLDKSETYDLTYDEIFHSHRLRKRVVAVAFSPLQQLLLGRKMISSVSLRWVDLFILFHTHRFDLFTVAQASGYAFFARKSVCTWIWLIGAVDDWSGHRVHSGQNGKLAIAPSLSLSLSISMSGAAKPWQP